jgi:hypothetical protein
MPQSDWIIVTGHGIAADEYGGRFSVLEGEFTPPFSDCSKLDLADVAVVLEDVLLALFVQEQLQ